MTSNAHAPKTSKGLETRVAVVTGGHTFDVPNFHRLFRDLEGVDPYIQSIDDFAASPKEVRQSYDAIVFFIMMLPSPEDEGHEWYAGKPLTALSELGEVPQGIVIFHHALFAYPQWPQWDEIVGISNRKGGYELGVRVTTNVALDHPITRGSGSCTMIDETYTLPNASEGSQILLTCQHSSSMKTLAWIRQYRQSRVFCYQGGHDNSAWSQPTFREVLRRGILWSADRLST
ncbi:MAG: ThuA domain-containing protein [Capsulimonadaceae bacterium]|nr:ThuA domain-containing protein [Capsulimonadaceae bacterium]